MANDHIMRGTDMQRRRALWLLGATGVALGTSPIWAALAPRAPLFRISLAQWSLHRALQGGRLDNLDFAATARREFEIDAVEYVSQFFPDKADDTAYLESMRRRATDAGVQSLLIMVDGEGALGAPDADERSNAVERHHKWVRAAKHLGCHSIRVNAESSGSRDEQRKLAADGLRRLTEFAEPFGIGVIVENHGGLSSDGAWLLSVIDLVDMDACGTLPDFGNFWIKDDKVYDRYQGVEELMPYAKAVSAKSYAFASDGRETTIDYERMLKIVVDSGYRGHVGIEYEGADPDEFAGVRATKTLLETVRAELKRS